MDQQNASTPSACLLCGGTEFIVRLKPKDHTVTGETFDIRSCKLCGFCHTSPQPSPQTISKYYDSEEYVSHSETRTGIINFLYGKVQKLNLQDKFRWVKKDVPRGTWLDYGGGAGAFMQYVQSKGQPIVGVEPDEKARTRAIEKGLDMRRPEEVAEIPNEEFAAITLWHVLEHIHNPREVLETLRDKLKPEGVLVIALPNLRSKDAHHYKEFWAGYDVPRHLWHFREKDIKILVKTSGFEYQITHPMKFDAFYVSMLSEKYMKWGSLTRGVWNGLRSNIHAALSGYPYSSQVYVFKKENRVKE